MLSLARQEPWFANFLLSEARSYRSRAIREIQAGAWPVGTLLDKSGDVVTPATVADASWILLAPFFEDQRAPALLIVRDAEINDSYVQYGVLNRAAVNDALLENSRLIVRPGPLMAGIEARDVLVSPPVAGAGEVQSALEYFDREMLTASGGIMTGALQLIEIDGAAPRTQAVNKGYVDSLVLGIASYVGRLNAGIDEVYYTPISGITPSPGPLCAPDVAGPGRYVICELAGIMPDGAWLAGTAFSYGDYAMSDGETWYHLPFRTSAVTGSMVALTPPVLGADEVQRALGIVETRLANTVAKTGDTITGILTLDPGVPGLPAIVIRQPAGGSGAALYIQGNPTGQAAAIEGDLHLSTGNLNLVAGAVSAMAGYIMSRQFYLGVDLNCGYLLGPDSSSGGLWRNQQGQLTLRRPPGQSDIYSEDNNAVTRSRLLTELDRAAPAIIEPAQLNVPAGGSWVNYWTGNYPIPRGGNSRILLTVSVNVDIPGSGGGLVVGGLRCTLDNLERRVFMYKPLNYGSGFTAALCVDVTGTNPALTVELAALDPNTGSYTALGGAGNPGRSQILITDLGPR